MKKGGDNGRLGGSSKSPLRNAVSPDDPEECSDAGEPSGTSAGNSTGLAMDWCTLPQTVVPWESFLKD
jgi:hypothetical protein